MKTIVIYSGVRSRRGNKGASESPVFGNLGNVNATTSPRTWEGGVAGQLHSALRVFILQVGDRLGDGRDPVKDASAT